MIPKNGKYLHIDMWTAPAEYQLEKKLWDGTGIRVSQRVGDDERMWVRDKLERMHIFGFLDQATYQARDNAAVQAITREDLNKLISDLPAHEDDWRNARKVPMDRAVLQQAIEAMAPKKSNLASAFPLFLVLGMFGFLAGAIGLDAHTATGLTICAAMLAFMSLVSILAGILLARMT